MNHLEINIWYFSFILRVRILREIENDI
jgi:hypothetical protein